MVGIVLGLVVLVLGRSLVDGANILALMPTASPSHHVWNRVLIQALADRGHKIVYISPDKDPSFSKNIQHVHLDGIYEVFNRDVDIEGLVENGMYSIVTDFTGWGILNCKLASETNGVQILKNMSTTHTFDLVIYDFTLNECLLGFVPLFKNPPIIGVSGFGGHVHFDWLTGSPASLAYKPIVYSTYTSDMSVFQKINNILVYLYTLWDWYYVYIPQQQQFADILFDNSPPVLDILKRINVFLLNTHFIFDYSSPKTPGLVPVGGLQIIPPKPLPKDIQDFIDNATDGAILFSLGTNVRSSKIKPEKLKILLDAFQELAPIKILWKWEQEQLPGKPENVKIAKWLPQRDILHHPKILLFLTHSGLLSTHEAVHEGVPVVGIPFLGDQHINIRSMVALGLGVSVDYRTMTKTDVLSAIRTVLENPRYKKRAKELSRVFRDQKETPLERAVYWTEYVLRHKGAAHIRSPGADISWYQHWLLDIALVVLVMLALTVYTIVVVLRIIRRAVRGTNSKLKAN